MATNGIPELEIDFPRLQVRPITYEKTSDETISYNCIAYAAGDRKNWWDDSRMPPTCWPVANDDGTIEALKDVFVWRGYVECGEDTRVERGYEKVALYSIAHKWRHAARQLPDGRWSSKCGEGIDISHILDGLMGSVYGTDVLIMKRSWIRRALNWPRFAMFVWRSSRLAKGAAGN